MKKIFVIGVIFIITLIVLLSCSKILDANNTTQIYLNLIFPETDVSLRNQIEVITLRIFDNDTFDETFELEIENNIATGAIELEYGVYSFYVEAGFFENEIFHLLYFGSTDNFDINESSNFVEINLIECVAPVAVFSGSPTSGTVPLVVQFTDLSIPGSFPITDWLWNFGDGNTSTSQNPSHTFTVEGDHTVELTVTSSIGTDNEVIANYINVAPTPIGPTANFSGTPTSGNAPLTVQFTDLSIPGTSPITDWLWVFGDGNTSTSQNPSHTFTTKEDYTIELTVTSSVGTDSEVIVNYINVQFNDDFESYDNFALEFAPWTQYDGDGMHTYSITGYTFPNQEYTGSFIIFNPSLVDPPLTDLVTPHSGDKMAACFASLSLLNDDWLISPETKIVAGDEVSFFAKSYNNQYGLERFNVAVSITGNAPADFIVISGTSSIEAPLDWTEYNFDLSSYAGQDVYVAIQCVSADVFIFFVDDFHIGIPADADFLTIDKSVVSDGNEDAIIRSNSHKNIVTPQKSFLENNN